jgi:predicted CXXCH cytochrome family protein
MTVKKVALLVCIVGMAGFLFANSWVIQDATAKGSPYEADIKPLTTAECAQCHLSVFQAIKADGGKHQIDCVQCHTQYHVYNPRKQNYDAIMPKCAQCHLSASGGPFHGEGEVLTPCLECHADPHKPLVIPMPAEAACPQCHAEQGNEIKNFPSKHTTDVACTDCHAETHGYIPDCSACHESHSPEVQMASADCMTCHPVHKPTQIAYAKETGNAICAGCHGDVQDMLQANVTLHTDVLCADCHPAHKEIPLCSRCHGEPHPKTMMVDVTACGECHGIAHDLAK